MSDNRPLFSKQIDSSSKVSSSTKGESKSSKRKLFGTAGVNSPVGVQSTVSSTAEEETSHRKSSSSRRRSHTRDRSASPLSPSPAVTSSSLCSSSSSGGGGSVSSSCITPLRTNVPVSERQQVALLRRQMTLDQSYNPDSNTQPASPHTPSSSTIGGASSSSSTTGASSSSLSPHSNSTKRTPLERRANKRNERGETALHLVAIKGGNKQAEQLIKAGADVNVKDFAGWTPLHEACNHGWLEVAQLLLNAGANVNVKGLDNDTPLHDASVNGHEQLVKLLVSHGANPLQINSRGKSPLDVAASAKISALLRQEIVDFSSSESEPVNPSSPSSPESLSNELKDNPIGFNKNKSELSGSKVDSSLGFTPCIDSVSSTNSFSDTSSVVSGSSDSHPVSTNNSGSNLTAKSSTAMNRRTEKCDNPGYGSTDADSSSGNIAGTSQHVSSTTAADNSHHHHKSQQGPVSQSGSPSSSSSNKSTSSHSNQKQPIKEPSKASKDTNIGSTKGATQSNKEASFAVYQFEDETESSVMPDRTRYTSPRVDKDKLSPKVGNRSPKPERSSPKPFGSMIDSTSSKGDPSSNRLSISTTSGKDKSDREKERTIKDTKASPKHMPSSLIPEETSVKRPAEEPHPKEPAIKRSSTPTPVVFTSQAAKLENSSARSSPKPDRVSPKPSIGSDSPPSLIAMQKGSPKVPPLKIIINSKASTSSGQTSSVSGDVDNGANNSSQRQTLPYIVHSSEDSMSQSDCSSTSSIVGNTITTTTSFMSSSNKSGAMIEPMDVDLVPSVTNLDSTSSSAVGSSMTGSDNSNMGGNSSSNIVTTSVESNVTSTEGLTTTHSEQIVTRRSKERDGKSKEFDLKDEIKSENSANTDDSKSTDSGHAKGTTEHTREKRVTRSAARTAQQKQKQPRDDHKEAIVEDMKEEDTFMASVSTATTSNSSSACGSTHCNSSSSGSSNTTRITAAPQIKDEEINIHPRKRKHQKHQKQDGSMHQQHHQQQQQQQPAPVRASTSSTATTTTTSKLAEKIDNTSYSQYLAIRRQIEKKRNNWEIVQPKAPPMFEHYHMLTKDYLLQGNVAVHFNERLSPPDNLHPKLKEVFKKHEMERLRVRMRQTVEKDKLKLSCEQEVLREYGRAARAMCNQDTPLSVCTVLKDDEVYNTLPPPPDEEDKEKNVRSRYNARQLLSWLQDVQDKFERFKRQTVHRQIHEVTSLHSVQKLEWEWILRQTGQCEYSATPEISLSHVPIVIVEEEFELLPK